MKQILILAITLTGLQSLTAQEINSGVIHNYNYVGASYHYAHGDNAPDGHGGSGFVSYDLNNFLFGVGGSYLQGDENNQEFETWSVYGAVGYVMRLQENHINIIPNFGIGYSQSESSFRIPFIPLVFKNDIDSTIISPGITFSYAFCNYISVNAGYSYGYDLDTEADSHGFSVGVEFAVSEQVGLHVTSVFDDHQGFTGVNAGVTFHF